MHGDKNKFAIEYLSPVVKEDIPKLDKHIKEIIQRKIEKLVDEPYLGLPLRGELAGCYKLRISKYRVVYKIFQVELIILIIAIEKRENLAVYKTALKRMFLKD